MIRNPLRLVLAFIFPLLWLNPSVALAASQDKSAELSRQIPDLTPVIETLLPLSSLNLSPLLDQNAKISIFEDASGQKIIDFPGLIFVQTDTKPAPQLKMGSVRIFYKSINSDLIEFTALLPSKLVLENDKGQTIAYLTTKLHQFKMIWSVRQNRALSIDHQVEGFSLTNERNQPLITMTQASFKEKWTDDHQKSKQSNEATHHTEIKSFAYTPIGKDVQIHSQKLSHHLITKGMEREGLKQLISTLLGLITQQTDRAQNADPFKQTQAQLNTFISQLSFENFEVQAPSEKLQFSLKTADILLDAQNLKDTTAHFTLGSQINGFQIKQPLLSKALIPELFDMNLKAEKIPSKALYQFLTKLTTKRALDPDNILVDEHYDQFYQKLVAAKSSFTIKRAELKNRSSAFMLSGKLLLNPKAEDQYTAKADFKITGIDHVLAALIGQQIKEPNVKLASSIVTLKIIRELAISTEGVKAANIRNYRLEITENGDLKLNNFKSPKKQLKIEKQGLGISK